jgi:hypothetical protein
MERNILKYASFSPNLMYLYNNRQKKSEGRREGRRQEAGGRRQKAFMQKAEVKKLQTSDFRLKTFSPTPYTLHHTPNKTPNP